MKILNTINEDYHIHSLNWSDGMNTIDEIVQYVGKIWMKEIAITDHSQIALDKNNIPLKNRRGFVDRWKNVHNDVNVIFWLEADLLDDEWNCCMNLQWLESDFCILSCHKHVYEWKLENITQAYINTINNYHERIKFIWHICMVDTSEFLDVEAIAKVLNQYKIPIELNCSYLNMWRTNLEKLNKLIHLVKAGVYVNSDMHALNDFNLRQAGFDYLKEQGLK